MATETQIQRLLAAWDVIDGNRGWLSCFDQHDIRCLRRRKQAAECACGADEFRAAIEALRGD